MLNQVIRGSSGGSAQTILRFGNRTHEDPTSEGFTPEDPTSEGLTPEDQTSEGLTPEDQTHETH